ncbi:uncharacterized protein LOC113498873 [Trichoplusia ni]|uniref:Uncharacterized protein LOC113498873 n=1 Tax=Trichoplusia ni TaxID=7111 RepID=A0A7E5W2T5_TRINI|nr:uncharacterized protein LOC113498873 [Trichoplusia ni]
MDQLFTLLQASGNNSLDKIVNLFKEAKILDTTEVESKIRDLFKDVPNPQDISLEKFTEVVTAFANEHGKTMEELTDMLTLAGTELLKLTEDVENALTLAAESMTSGPTPSTF